jgi:hypothetical protein
MVSIEVAECRDYEAKCLHKGNAYLPIDENSIAPPSFPSTAAIAQAASSYCYGAVRCVIVMSPSGVAETGMSRKETAGCQ